MSGVSARMSRWCYEATAPVEFRLMTTRPWQLTSSIMKLRIAYNERSDVTMTMPCKDMLSGTHNVRHCSKPTVLYCKYWPHFQQYCILYLDFGHQPFIPWFVGLCIGRKCKHVFSDITSQDPAHVSCRILDTVDISPSQPHKGFEICSLQATCLATCVGLNTVYTMYFYLFGWSIIWESVVMFIICLSVVPVPIRNLS